MQIQIDSREKQRAIKKILAEFKKQSVGFYVSKLYVGDYMSIDNPRLVVDRKQNLSELYGNLCHDRKRFIAELTRAASAGINVVILVEHGGGIRTAEDVKTWKNPRLEENPYAWDGVRMYTEIRRYEKLYGVRFEFCDKAHTGAEIIRIVGGEKCATMPKKSNKV